jgi:hypothetical protein
MLFQMSLFAAVCALTSHHGLLAGLGFLPLFGTVASVPGSPDFTVTGSAKIPWLFSRKAIVKFYDESVLPFIAQRDYEGEIKALGDRITIDTIPTITISKYTKGMNLNDWQDVDSPSVEMYINRATIFKFKMDKIDIAQFLNKDKMNQCAKDAAEQQAIYVDTEALSELYAYADPTNQGATAGRKSGLYNLGVTGTPVVLTEANILRYILMCQAVGNEQNWPKTDRWLVLPTWANFLLEDSDIKDAHFAGDGPSLLVNGHRIGRIGNFQVYESNLYTPISDSGYECYPILFGHKSAISFASQLNEVEYFDKLESTVGKGMRGIQLYDWKVTKGVSLGVLYARMGQL